MTEDSRPSAQARSQVSPSVLPAWADRVGRWSWAFIGAAAACVIVLFTLAMLSDVVVPLVVAIVAAVAVAPMVDRLETLRLPRSVAAGLVTLLVVVFGAAMVLLVAIGVGERSDELRRQIQLGLSRLSTTIDQPTVSGFLERATVDLGNSGSSLLNGVGPSVTSLIGSVVGLISSLTLALVLLYYLLKDGRGITARLVARRSEHERAQAERILAQAAETLRANSRQRTLLSAIQGVAVTLVLTALGVPLAATVGIVNFVGGFVPFLGAFVGGVFAVLMALSEGGIPLAIAALVAVFLMNALLEGVLEPRMISSSIRQHPVITLTVTVAGGVVAGLLGLILAAPAVAIVTNVVRELRSSGVIGARPSAQPHAAQAMVAPLKPNDNEPDPKAGH